MDFNTFISYIPKLAATLLVILGILRIIEIRAMLIRQKQLKFDAAEKKEELIAVVKFPQTTARMETVNKTKQTSFSFTIPLLISIVIIVVVYGGYTYLKSNPQLPVTQQTELSPTPEP